MLLSRVKLFDCRAALVALALALLACTASAQGVYRRAGIDTTGRLRLILSGGRVIRPARDSEQVGFEQVAISDDHQVVGWLALYPNCCTSYPIPLELVLLRADGQRTIIGNALTIWQWGFARDGKHVVIRQAPVHGDAPVQYELHEIRTGRLVAAIQKDSTASLPKWTRVAQPESNK